MRAVDAVIRARLDSEVVLIRTIGDYIVGAGGKRMRPAMVLLVAGALGYRGDNHHRLAAVVEFIHTATLLHDDVVDESDMRRGRETANAVFGNAASVLVGDYLYSRSFEMMVETDSMGAMAVLSAATTIIAEGEVLQLLNVHDPDVSLDRYLQVVRYKTAKLFEAAAQVGAIISGATPRQQTAAATYGRHIGTAFQLIDDVLDYRADQTKLGKTVGDDFREGKITLPVILAFRRGNDEERTFWRRTLEDLEQTDDDLARAIELMEKHGALSDSVDRARHYGAIARDALGIFKECPEKRALINLIDFCIQRVH